MQSLLQVKLAKGTGPTSIAPVMQPLLHVWLLPPHASCCLFCTTNKSKVRDPAPVFDFRYRSGGSRVQPSSHEIVVQFSCRLSWPGESASSLLSTPCTLFFLITGTKEQSHSFMVMSCNLSWRSCRPSNSLIPRYSRHETSLTGQADQANRILILRHLLPQVWQVRTGFFPCTHINKPLLQVRCPTRLR